LTPILHLAQNNKQGAIMPVEQYTLVSYTGTDIGGIYLSDIGRSRQLGGAVQGEIGQDIYINKGETICLTTTGDVLLSSAENGSGVLKRYSTDNEPALLDLLVKSGTLPQGTTGFAAPLDLIPSASVTGVVRFGTTGIKADPENTVGDF
jgi:hypothetical protein